MPIPSVIGDLSATASLNSPSGSENVSTSDDYLRSIQAIVKTVYDAQQTTNGLKANAADYLALAGGTMTGDLVMSGASIIETEGAAVASATTADIWATDGNTRHVTGSVTITSFGTAPQAGARMKLIFDGTPQLTQSANLNLNAGGSNITIEAGDWAEVYADTTTQFDVVVHRKSGAAVVGSVKQIQPIAASVGSSALTVTLNPTTLDFRSSTLSSGTVNTRTISSAISLVISSGSTLGTVSAQQSRIVVLAIDNAGTVELAAVNIAGGNDLSETGLISTTAEGGAGAADSANVIYSTTARTNVPYRVVGYVESTQATAGTWATAPSTIQGYGGQALAAMSSLGYGQTWQSVTRTSGTTYYNKSGKAICLKIEGTGTGATVPSVQISINAATAGNIAQTSAGAGTPNFSGNIIIPPFSSYILTDTNVVSRITYELR